MKMIKIAVVLFSFFFASQAVADVSFGVKYYQPATEQMGNSLYYEIAYDKEFAKNIFWEATLGYSDIEITDMSNSRREFLKFVPIKFGVRYDWKFISLRSGVAYHLLHLDVVNVDDEFGGYWGVGLHTNTNPDIYVDLTQILGDVKIEYPILEDRSTMQGWLLGAGVKFKF